MENSYILGRGVDEDKQTLWDIGMHFFSKKNEEIGICKREEYGGGGPRNF